MSTLLLVALLLATESPSPQLTSVKVPPALLQVTSNPELSGIVWSSLRQRYLVVTDDSGLRENETNHRPLLLALSEGGRLDETPIYIQGIDKLNDAESICAGPESSYFVVTSHSPNRDGKTPSARRQLLYLKDSPQGLKVAGRLDLTEVKGHVGLLGAAGLPPDGRLDIEAVTYHKKDLFIGFKSPLTSSGEASIVRIAEPLKAFKAGRLHSRDLHLFATVRLCVDGADPEPVCEGISDMTFLPSGQLLLTANTPKGAPKDHGGALWLLSNAGARPGLLHRFPHRKPEGVTLSAKRDALVIVFDRDESEPEWTQLPLPIAPPASR